MADKRFKSMDTIKRNLAMAFLLFVCQGSASVFSQITERPRPKEWDNLVEGARFIDRFLPMPEGKLSANVWGGENVVPRFVDNGIEDDVRSYWGGNIIKGDDGKYHLYVCGWREDSPKGHHTWPQSIVYHTVCDNSVGPYIIKDTIGPGHNPEIFKAKNGQYVVYVIDGYYLSDSLDGPWKYGKFKFNPRDRKIIEGLSNLTFTKREDGSNLMICRGGGVWISRTGLSEYSQISNMRVYPAVDGEFEDPVVWKDNVQYHLIVNDWLGRIAFYLRSKDGVNWVTDPGEAYLPGVISKHKDGHCENWFKYERIKILQDKYGRAIQANFAVIDTLKNEDLPNDRHSSKNISIPLNPGMLLTMLNKEPVDEDTKEVRVLVEAEEGFSPLDDLDLNSLRFGSSEYVNYGKGTKVLRTEKSGNNLIMVFDAKGCGVDSKEFAPKVIGKKKDGSMVFGFMRVPWVDYTPSILSARKPTILPGDKIEVYIDNFGLKASADSKFELYAEDGKDRRLIVEGLIPPIEPYSDVKLVLDCKNKVDNADKGYVVRILSENGENIWNVESLKK